MQALFPPLHRFFVSRPTVFYHPRYEDYFFGPQHPFRPARQHMLLDLLDALGHAPETAATPCASRDEVRAVHDAGFVEAVEAASRGGALASGGGRYGLGRGGDTPAFEGMDEAARWLTGGTLAAARALTGAQAPPTGEDEQDQDEQDQDEQDQDERGQDGREQGAAQPACTVALQMGGGLHHAHAGRASGFCVYNDLAVAIRHFLEAGLAVAYIDIDVHHGDGVQSIFYREPRVLTISLHESGRHLFPGTGFPSERGEGPAVGTSINVPLAPNTTDDSYLEAFEAVVPPALSAFGPDVIVAQCGADAHAKDPLAHLALTTHGYAALFQRLHALAGEHGGGRLLATHGGGYDLDAAARVWALQYLTFAGLPIPEEPLPEAWRERWRGRHGTSPAATLHDTTTPDVPDRADMEDYNRRSAAAALGRGDGSESF